MLQYYTILTPKQDNGQWGTPLYLTSIKGGMMSAGEENQELLSAILMAFAENKKCNMILEVMPRIFSIRTESNSYNYSYNNWGLDGNNLYYLVTDDDRKEFSRMIKLKKLTHDRLQTNKEKNS